MSLQHVIKCWADANVVIFFKLYFTCVNHTLWLSHKKGLFQKLLLWKREEIEMYGSAGSVTPENRTPDFFIATSVHTKEWCQRRKYSCGKCLNVIIFYFVTCVMRCTHISSFVVKLSKNIHQITVYHQPQSRSFVWQMEFTRRRTWHTPNSIWERLWGSQSQTKHLFCPSTTYMFKDLICLQIINNQFIFCLSWYAIEYGKCNSSLRMYQSHCRDEKKKRFYFRKGLFGYQFFLYRAFILEQSSLAKMKGI